MKRGFWYYCIIILLVLVIVAVFWVEILALIAIFLLFVLIPSPIERIIYKRSKYYQTYQKKYSLACTWGIKYKIYNKLSKEMPNIKFIGLDKDSHFIIINNNTIYIFIDTMNVVYNKENNNLILEFEEKQFDDDIIEETVNTDNMEQDDAKTYKYELRDLSLKYLKSINIDYEYKKIIYCLDKSTFEEPIKIKSLDNNIHLYHDVFFNMFTSNKFYNRIKSCN